MSSHTWSFICFYGAIVLVLLTSVGLFSLNVTVSAAWIGPAFLAGAAFMFFLIFN